jgi:hypothetical protein
MDIDVKKVMLTLLEREKRYVEEDLDDYGSAMVVVFTADNQSYLVFPKFEDEKSKIAQYSAIVEAAKSKDAVLIVTVNSARTMSNPTEAEMESYEWGHLDARNSGSCILLTASGPGVQSCSLELGFEIKNGKVEFDAKPDETNRIQLNLLPNWPGIEPHGLI